MYPKFLWLFFHFVPQVKVVMGPSVLALHRAFKLPVAVVVDDLHRLNLGVTRHLLHLIIIIII